jgi:Skp family chaperone for outer membrane proteins
MSELLADPFSEVTRSRQHGMLIAASVSLLLSAGVATLHEVGPEEIKLTFSAPELVIWISAAVTFYFLITYCLGVFADTMLSRAKQWSPLASIAEMEATMDIEHDLRRTALADLTAAVAESPSATEVTANIDAVWNKHVGRIDEIRGALKALPPVSTASDADNQRRLALRKALADLNEAVRIEMNHANDSRISENSKKFHEASAHLNVDRILPDWEERTQMMRTLRTSSLIARLRLGIEIVLPTTYAMIALIWSIYNVVTGQLPPLPPIPHLKPPFHS